MIKRGQVLVLVGPKHSGKSSVTYALRQQLDCRAGDLDNIIEKRTGKTPRQLYLAGPDVLQREEVDKLKFVLQKEAYNQKSTPLILATGGGIIDNPEAIELILEFPDVVVIYLEVAAETAWQRVELSARSYGLPPFLADADDPQAAHCALHERRAAAYRRIATFTIDTEGKNQDEIAAEILKNLFNNK